MAGTTSGGTPDWRLDSSVIPWRLSGGTDLGSLAVPANTVGTACTDSTNCPTLGQTYSLSNASLATFLNNDPDGVVTFAVVRTDPSSNSNLSFASMENGTYAGPKLSVPGAGFGYAVSYDINGGTGSVPAQGQYVVGTPYTVAAPSSVIPPAGRTFADRKSVV